jgi:hypothetical protein
MRRIATIVCFAGALTAVVLSLYCWGETVTIDATLFWLLLAGMSGVAYLKGDKQCGG